MILLLLALAHARIPELELHLTLRASSDPLTTERVWSLEPAEPNPHRRRWAIARETGLIGLQAVKSEELNLYTVGVEGVRAVTTTLLRGPGKWYRPFADFPCTTAADPAFATEAGTRQAAEAAARSWHQLLEASQLKLAFLFSKIREPKPEDALASAQRAFKAWIQTLEAAWTAEGPHQARVAEWRSYQQAAQREGVCPRKAAAPIPPWEQLIEPAPEQPKTPLLARLPAKRWGGLFTVRMSAGFGDKTLNGRFLVDPAAPTSVVSPEWLKVQGVNPALVELPGVPAQPLLWSGGHGMAKRAVPFEVKLGGQPVPLTEFRLMKTELFEPPKYLGPCCDGILGTDVLKHFVVEFLPGPPSELILYERRGFSLGRQTPWAEVTVTPKGSPLSATCGVYWDLGNPTTLQANFPPGSPGALECAGVKIPLGTTWEPLRAAGPSIVGAGLLDRGSLYLDLGHGRVWLSRGLLEGPPRQNRTGILAVFRSNPAEDADRQLKVLSLRAGSPADALRKQGFGPGSVIFSIDDLPADEMDHWEVDRRLAGAYGEKIKLQWRVGKTTQTAELAVSGKN